MNRRIFILKKDLPDVKAGAEFVLGKATDAYYLTSDKTETLFNCYVYPKEWVEQNTEWFVEKVQKSPLGIVPFRVHNEIRLSQINDAIKRYEAFGLEVPFEWFAERESLNAFFQTQSK